MKFILSCITILLLGSCQNLNYVSVYDVDPNPQRPIDLFPYKDIFTDSEQTGIWGTKYHPCKEIVFDSVNNFSGNDHLHIKWDDSGDCNYIGFGFKWGNYKGKNLLPIYNSAAIEFMIRLETEEKTKIPMFFSLLDYSGKQCNSKINLLDVEGKKMDTSWRKVRIPLSTFNYQKKDINISNIKELRVELQRSGDVHIDNMRIVSHQHNFGFDASDFTKSYNSFPIPIGQEKKYWWGVNPNFSENFKFSTQASFSNNYENKKGDSVYVLPEIELELSLKVNYDKKSKDNKWNDFGFPFNKWEFADFSSIYSTSAIQFITKTNTPPKIQLTLVSYSGKKRRLQKIPQQQHFTKRAEGIYEFVVPIKSFQQFEEFNWEKLKEIRFKVLETATFEIGNFKIIEFRGNPQKPFKWIGT